MIQVEEIAIEVPWGIVASKWWGPKDIRPILCVHGWQDNAGSFDALIPLLPKHLSYLAIDLPGHGLSSRLPAGMLYSTVSYFYTIKFIVKKFQWEKVSLVGHSLGAMILFLYASLYPDRCDLYIALDSLHTFESSMRAMNRYFIPNLKRNIIAEARNRDNTEPTAFTYDECMDKLNSSKMMSVKRPAAPYLLNRAIKPSTIYPDKFYFTRDGRVKSIIFLYLSYETILESAKQLTAPICYIKSSNLAKIKQTILHALAEASVHFEQHDINGEHHTHLNEPHRISEILSNFINRFRPLVLVNKL